MFHSTIRIWYEYTIRIVYNRMSLPPRLRATAPNFIPEQERIRIQMEKNRIRNDALTIAMKHRPTLISKIGATSTTYDPFHQNNIRAPYEDLKIAARVPELLYKLYGRISKLQDSNTEDEIKDKNKMREDAKTEIVNIICKGVRLEPDVFANLFYYIIKNRDFVLVNTILNCNKMADYTKKYYFHAEYFENDAGKTLYNLIDDTNLKIAEKLYDLGFDINYLPRRKLGMYDTYANETAQNFTPLEEAIANAQPKLVKFLLEKGANPPTNPASLYRAIVPFVKYNTRRRIPNETDIHILEKKINTIYGLPELNFGTMLNEFIYIKDMDVVPPEPKIKRTIVKALETAKARYTTKYYTDMIQRFIDKFKADGGVAEEVIEDPNPLHSGGLIRKKQTRRKRSKRTRKVSKRLK